MINNILTLKIGCQMKIETRAISIKIILHSQIHQDIPLLKQVYFNQTHSSSQIISKMEERKNKYCLEFLDLQNQDN